MWIQAEESLGTHSESRDGAHAQHQCKLVSSSRCGGLRHLIKLRLCLTTAPTGGRDQLCAGSHGEARDEAARLPSGISNEQKKLVKR